MPIKVYWQDGGPFAVCDSAQEAAELLRLSRNGAISPAVKINEPIRSSALESTRPPDLSKFFSKINANAKKIFSALAKHPNGITGEDFAKEVGVSSDKFGGILGGASKNAKNLHFELNQLMLSEVRVEGNRRYRFLQPTPLLVANADRIIQRFPR